MATRLGEVEDQVYEDESGDYWNEDEEAMGDYWAGNDSIPTEGGGNKKDEKRNKRNDSAMTASSSLMCPMCGSRQIEAQEASGASICTECGVVVEENAIVSAIEFVEGNGGSSSMVGQFVSGSSSKAYSSRPGRPGGFSKDSRETTLANGRRRIQDVASRLRLGGMFVDSAHRLFTVAVEKNFVQGRRTTHVVSACLYIACRQEKSQHMLIDFSDALQVNVYTLGATFLKFRRLLGLKLEIIDPALYVYRFAAHLDLDEKANAVSLTALRLVARMKRDWIVAGRRPAGICAAALLIAARAHGFSRHHQDVTRILRVCGLTVATRVREFEQTPTAALTLHQFNNVELDQEMDPPRFTKNKILEARAKAIQENNFELLTSGALDDPLAGRGAKRWRDPNRHQKEKHVKFRQLYSSIEQELVGTSGDQVQLKGSYEGGKQENEKIEQTQPTENPTNNGESLNLISKGESCEQGGDIGEPSGQLKEDDCTEEKKDAPPNHEGPAGNVDKTPEVSSEKAAALEVVKVPASENQLQIKIQEASPQFVVPTEWEDAYPKSRYGRNIVLSDHATPEEMMEPTAPVEARLSMSKWKEDLPDFITDEIESMFRSEEEVAKKEVIFNKINKDYIEQQERKEKDRLGAEAADKGREVDEAAQAEGRMRYLKSNRGRKKKRIDGVGDDLTTEEALMAAVNNRKISRKINYDAMSSIFDDDGTFATDANTTQMTEGGMEFGEL